MVEAFMLIQTDVGRAEVVAKQLAALRRVAEYVPAYDVVVRIGADTATCRHVAQRQQVPASRAR